MSKVQGIGGIFFKARDADKLRAWYREHLGIEFDDGGGWSFLWRQKENPQRVGRTVWAPFPAETEYFDPSNSPFMFNFRVDDLDQMLGDLRKAGIQVEDTIEEYTYGRFGWAIDPEGNKLEFWQPMGEEGQAA